MERDSQQIKGTNLIWYDTIRLDVCPCLLGQECLHTYLMNYLRSKDELDIDELYTELGGLE